MTLEKAIEILDRYYTLHFDVPLAELNEAATLGIEALKRIQNLRLLYFDPPRELLPGETKE